MSRKCARWKLPRLSSIFYVVTAWLWLLFFVLLKSKRIGPASECNATTTWSLWHHCVFAVGTLKGCPQGRRNTSNVVGIILHPPDWNPNSGSLTTTWTILNQVLPGKEVWLLLFYYVPTKILDILSPAALFSIHHQSCREAGFSDWLTASYFFSWRWRLVQCNVLILHFLPPPQPPPRRRRRGVGLVWCNVCQ